jgi:hypothetical protein
MENNSVFFPVKLLAYIIQNLAMKRSAILLVVGVAAALAVVIAPALVESASAAIRDVCEKNDNIREGECKGNTDRNGKDDQRVNNNDFPPPGQNRDED